jgi:ParB-like chromosome segregation protein Spo0J
MCAGHGRLVAARQLGLAEVPVEAPDHLSEAQQRACIIADSRLAMNAGWDEKLLTSEVRALELDGANLALAGFSDEELAALLEDAAPPEEAAHDAVPEPPALPVTRPGDVWLIGRRRLVCSDRRDLAVIEKLMAGGRANACITSPPWADDRRFSQYRSYILRFPRSRIRRAATS